jgi:hypothetical protein
MTRTIRRPTPTTARTRSGVLVAAFLWTLLGATDPARALGPFQITQPAPYSYTNQTRPTAVWTASTGATEYQVQVSYGAYCQNAFFTSAWIAATSLQLPTLAQSWYSLCVTARDGGGATLAASNSGMIFNVDLTPPVDFTITAPPGLTNANRPTVTWVRAQTPEYGSPNYTYTLDVVDAQGCGTVVQTYTTTSAASSVSLTLTTALPDGAYTLNLTAQDPAGNTKAATNSGYGFTVDTVPPAAPTVQGPNATARIDYPLSWTVANPSGELLGFEVRKSRGATCDENPTVQTYASTESSNQQTIQLDQGSGPYLICVTAIDAAGNRATGVPKSVMSSIPLGNQDWAVIAVRSPDQGSTPSAAELTSRFAGPICDRFLELSFGQFRPIPTVFDLQRSTCGDPTGAEIEQAITARGYRVYDFDHVVVLRNCGGLFSAQFNLEDPQRAVPGYGLFAAFVFYGDASENSGTLIQEVMHGYGLYFHANRWACQNAASLYGSGCSSVEYGNLFDAMGSSAASININAYYKEVANWLGPSRIRTITQNGRYSLRPYNSTTGYVAAKLRHPQWPSSQPQYFVEYRNAVGADAGMGSATYSSNTLGLMLNTGFFATSATGTNSESLLLDLTPADTTNRVTLNPGGGTYIDPVRGISVTAVGTNGAGDMEFDVAFLPFDCSFVVSPYFQVDGNRLASISFSAGVERRVDQIVRLYEFNNPACHPSGLDYTVRFLPAGWSGTPDTFTQGGWVDRKLASPSLKPPAGTAPGSYSVSIEVRNDTTGATATSSNYTVNVTP